MAGYRIAHTETIETKVGDGITIKTGSIPPLVGKISYSDDAFRLINQETTPSKNMGGRPTTAFTLIALLEGKHIIEYVRHDARDPANRINNFTKVYDADLYNIIVNQ